MIETDRPAARDFRFRPWAETGAIAMAIALTMASGIGAAHAHDTLPQEKTAGGIDYRVGGIGKDEAAAMRRISSEYPLVLTFAENLNGAHAYTAGVDVAIESTDGSTRFQTQADAPLLLVDLPQGRYDVTATLDGEQKRRTVSVQPPQTRRVYFEWSGT